MGLREAILRQFARPRGALGPLAGWIMAVRPSNRRRNLWTVDLLELRPEDRVLELGCGPGMALAAAARRAGAVVGVDHSPAMLAQAARRNRRAAAAGRVRLQLGSLDDVAGPFDKAFAVNVVQFLPDRAAACRAFHRVLVPGGTLALTYQPRTRRPTRADALAMADELGGHLRAAGFAEIRVEELALRPAPAVCVLARRPGG